MTIPITFDDSAFGGRRSEGFYKFDRDYMQWRHLRYHILLRKEVL